MVLNCGGEWKKKEGRTFIGLIQGRSRNSFIQLGRELFIYRAGLWEKEQRRLVGVLFGGFRWWSSILTFGHGVFTHSPLDVVCLVRSSSPSRLCVLFLGPAKVLCVAGIVVSVWDLDIGIHYRT